MLVVLMTLMCDHVTPRGVYTWPVSVVLMTLICDNITPRGMYTSLVERDSPSDLNN